MTRLTTEDARASRTIPPDVLPPPPGGGNTPTPPPSPDPLRAGQRESTP
ncbi:MAG: hypothetical protein LBE67_07585 [Kocuria palustris]|nr:hypothetical protein [Kocuria palustris]